MRFLKTLRFILFMMICSRLFPQTADNQSLIQINFQPQGVVPAGMIGDFGDRYGDRGNGLQYGWLNTDNFHAVRSNTTPNLVYDTFNYLESGRIWEIELPDGFYKVSIVMGDPNQADQLNNAIVEGVILNDSDGFDAFDEYNDFIVYVNDGNLSLTALKEAINAKINYISIIPADTTAIYQQKTIIDSCSSCAAAEKSIKNSVRMIPEGAETWINDPFDDLYPGPLSGQNGWTVDPGCEDAEIVEDLSADSITAKVIKLSPHKDNWLLRVNKPVDVDPSSINHTFEFDFKVESALSDSEAKIEVQTIPRPNESGKWAFKKFQIYFGKSVRLNYYYDKSILLVPVTQMNYWYHIKVDMSNAPGREYLNLTITGRDDQALIYSCPSLPMGSGPIVNISISSWERDDYAGQINSDYSGIVYLDNISGYKLNLPINKVWCVYNGNPVNTLYPCANEKTFRTLQEAINIAGENDAIYLANGIHRGIAGSEAVGVISSKSLTIIGGFTTSKWDVPTYGPTNTGLDGQNQFPVLLIRGNINVSLGNLYLTNGGIIRTQFDPQQQRGVLINYPNWPVIFRSGTSNDRFIVHGEMRFDSGIHNLQDGIDISGAGQMVVRGGMPVIENNGTIQNILLASGELRSHGNLRVTGQFNWTGGSIKDERIGITGKVSLQGIMNINAPGYAYFNNIIFENAGTVNWQDTASSNEYILCQNTVVINNLNTGIINMSPGRGYIQDYSGSGSLNNEGIINKLTAGTVYLNIDFSGGNLDVQGGSLILYHANSTTGTMNINTASGTIVDLTGGQPHTYYGEINGEGAGTILFKTGTLSVSSDGLTLNCPDSIFQWQGGVFTGPGILRNNMVMNINAPSYAYFNNIVFENAGTVNWQDTASSNEYILCQNTVVINNLSTGIINMFPGSGFIQDYSGSGSLNNEGIINKLTAGTVYLNIDFSGGNLDVQGGSLILYHANSTTGTMNINTASGTIVDLTGGQPHTYYGEINGEGAGTILFKTGTLSVLSDGLTLNCPDSIFQWQGGVFTGPGILRNNMVMNINAPSYAYFNNIAFENAGTVNWQDTASSNEYILCQNTVVINNLSTGIINMFPGSGFIQDYSGSGSLKNEGIINKLTNGTVYLNIDFSGGNLDVQGGSLILYHANSTTGTMNINAASGTIVDLTGGQPHTYYGEINGEGAGTILFKTGTLSVSSDGLTLNCPDSIFQWQGGVFTGPGTLRNNMVVNINAPSYAYFNNIVFENAGTVNWQDTASANEYIFCQNNTVIINSINGVFNMTPGNGFIQNYSSGTNSFNNFGEIIGQAAILIPMTNHGYIYPKGIQEDNPIGRISFIQFTQTDEGHLVFDLASLTSFDTILIADTADYAGVIDINYIADYQPVTGNIYKVITHNSFTGGLLPGNGLAQKFIINHNPADITLEAK